MKYKILDDELVEEISNLTPEDQALWLFISKHEEFQGALYVDALTPGFLVEFEEIIGGYRVLFPKDLALFTQRVAELGYRIAYTQDPSVLLSEYDSLRRTPEVNLQSSLEETTNGFLPWQIRGYNKLIRPEGLRGGLCFWDTGTGKTAFIASGILKYLDDVDYVFVVVKSNNKRDMQKKLKKLGNIDSKILDGTADKRIRDYLKIDEGSDKVIITNYEKLRQDREFFKELVTGRRILIFWDEMPTKLSNRTTQLYRAVKNILYKPGVGGSLKWENRRPSWLKQYELTATPIQRDPGGQYSCVRLIDPSVLGGVTQFEKEFVVAKNHISKKPIAWHNIDKIGYKLEYMTHRVDKTDPEVAKYFPKIYEDTITIDWHPKDRKVYDMLTNNAIALLEDGEDVSILALLTVMQMMCDAPEMVQASAMNREIYDELLQQAIENQDPSLIAGIKTGSEIAWRLLSKVRVNNSTHTKFVQLREDLEKYPGKVLLFSTWSSYIFPIFEQKLTEWGITYASYSGTEIQRQAAKDLWRKSSVDDVRVLICSDSASDSLDLPEASLVINYNLPWLYATKYQRIHRASRADSQNEELVVRNYVMDKSSEERRQELVEEREGYHLDFLKAGTKTTLSYNSQDYYYMLAGNSLPS